MRGRWVFAGGVAVTALLLALAPLQAESVPPATQPARDSFTLATFNINFGNLDLEKVVAAIRTADADVVALQETNAESARYLRRALGAVYPHMAFRTSPQRAGGFGFLSRTPLTNVRYLPPRHGMFGTLLAETHLVGRRVQLVNVHLEPVRLHEAEGWREVLEKYRDAEEVHAREWEVIEAALSAEVPVILLGDFNSLTSSVVPTRLRALGYGDSVAASSEAPEAQTTWGWPIEEPTVRLRIDYVFHPADLEARASRVVACQSSDHDLVAVELSWAPPEE